MTFLCFVHRCRDISLQTVGNHQVPCIPVTARGAIRVCIPVYRWVSVFSSAESNSTVSSLDFCLYINTYHWNKESTNSNKEICNELEVYSFMSSNCYSVGSPAVALVKRKLSVQGFEGCQALGSPTMQW